MNLSRPLVVCSFFGFGGSAIAKRIAALGGWPHVDVYEQTAHKLGEHKAVPHIGTENPAWSIAEERVIQRALTRKPCPVIGLSTASTHHIADLIQRQARLVVKGDWLQALEALSTRSPPHPSDCRSLREAHPTCTRCSCSIGSERPSTDRRRSPSMPRSWGPASPLSAWFVGWV